MPFTRKILSILPTIALLVAGVMGNADAQTKSVQRTATGYVVMEYIGSKWMWMTIDYRRGFSRSGLMNPDIWVADINRGDDQGTKEAIQEPVDQNKQDQHSTTVITGGVGGGSGWVRTPVLYFPAGCYGNCGGSFGTGRVTVGDAEVVKEGEETSTE